MLVTITDHVIIKYPNFLFKLFSQKPTIKQNKKCENVFGIMSLFYGLINSWLLLISLLFTLIMFSLPHGEKTEKNNSEITDLYFNLSHVQCVVRNCCCNS